MISIEQENNKEKKNPNLTENLNKGFISGGQSGTFISMN
jgi:hypothetical protein